MLTLLFRRRYSQTLAALARLFSIVPVAFAAPVDVVRPQQALPRAGGRRAVLMLMSALGMAAAVSPASAAQVPCTPDAGYTTCIAFTYSGVNQTYVVPAGVTSVNTKIWGAGGGGSDVNDPSYVSVSFTATAAGGAGGYTTGNLAVTSGSTLLVVVGQGGSSDTSGGIPTVATYGGGGAGGNASGSPYSFGDPNNRGSSGGGLSGLFLGTQTAGNARLLAGGGGGATAAAGSCTAANGGAAVGGGPTCNTTNTGSGGTQAASDNAATGTASCLAAAVAGSQFTGGAGSSITNASSGNNGGIYEGGGGGGGGWFGGGGGKCGTNNNGGGGGGSGYINGAGVSGASTIMAGTVPTNSNSGQGQIPPPNTTALQYLTGVGVGGAGRSSANSFSTAQTGGGNGLVVIQFVQATTVTVTKVSNGGTGTFAFSGTNGVANHNIVTATSGVGVAGATQTLTAAGTATTIIEAAPPAGFSLSSISCTGLGAGGTATPTINGASGGNVVLNAAATAAGSNIACTFTNTRLPTVTVTKISNGGAGTFAFSGTNGIAAHNIVTTTSGVGVAGTTQTLTAVGTATTITEAAPPAGFALASITCTGLGVGGTATPTINGTSGGNVVLNAAATAAGSNIACTFTNAKQPILRLQKQLPSGRFVAADQFTLSITGTGAPAPVTTTGAGNTATGTVTVNPATIGTSYTFSETGASGANLGNYAVTYTCSNALGSGQAPSGSGASFSISPVAGDDITCTFVNTRNPLADLSITKSNTTDTVTRGTTTTYTIVVTNNGPDAVTGAVVRDPAQAGLTCDDPVPCTGSGCPSPTVPLSTLQTSGVVLGTMPNGGTVTFALSCTVQ